MIITQYHFPVLIKLIIPYKLRSILKLGAHSNSHSQRSEKLGRGST